MQLTKLNQRKQDTLIDLPLSIYLPITLSNNNNYQHYKMKEIKVFIDLSDDLEKELFKQGLNIETLLQEEGLEPQKEEVLIEGKERTKGVLSYLLVLLSGYILREVLPAIAGKVLEEAGDQIIETAIGRALKPLLNWIEGNKKEGTNITININVMIPKKDENGEEVLELHPLTKEVVDKVEQVLIELKEEKKV